MSSAVQETFERLIPITSGAGVESSFYQII